jgi:protein-disulfide isomerase
VPLLEQVLEKNPKTVKIVFKNFPIRSHKFAAQAAVAALAADRQGKFWEFHDELFNNYNRLNEEKVQEIAAKRNSKKTGKTPCCWNRSGMISMKASGQAYGAFQRFSSMAEN